MVDILPTDPTIVPIGLDDLGNLIKAIGGVKALGLMGVVVVLVQGLLLAARSHFTAFLGKWKLVTVLLLTVVSGVIGLRVTGLTWDACLLHATTVAAFQVLVHQLYTQFTTKDG